MKERVILSISTIHGTKHFHLSKMFRKYLKIMGYSIVLSIIALASWAYYLSYEIDFAKTRQQELESESNSLAEELASLNVLRSNLEQDLLEREEQIQTVSDRLGDLEKVLGMDDSGNDLNGRLDSAAITSTVRAVMLTQIPNGAPVDDAPLSSGYGERVHPVTNQKRMHRGLDFAVGIGTPVYAPADGVVDITRVSAVEYGNFIRLIHTHGFTSTYSHLSKFAVKSGDFVQKGDLIGYSGNTGLSSGPHLHYEIRFVGKALDPRPFVDWNVNNFEAVFRKIRGVRWEFLVNRVEQRVSEQLQLSSPKVATSPES